MAKAKNLDEKKSTVGELRMQLRVQLIKNGTEYTVLEIGKHAGKTFKELLENHSSYAMWAQQEVERANDPDWRLAQFAYWAKHHAEMMDQELQTSEAREMGILHTPVKY